MAFRNLIISSEAELTLKNKQLRIQTENITDTVPIEDIDTVLVENRRTVLSAALLGALGNSGAALFICDEFHMPCAVLLPYLQHSRQHLITKKQLSMTAPAKKQLWRQIVTSKIENQAICLSLCGNSRVSYELLAISKNVKSGDSGNAEGHAAARYFAAVFGDSFFRGNEADLRNGWLNYGYAILRGCVARTLTSYGFFPTFGIHHHSQLNQFNLADDFLEPFRPLVDLFVAKNATAESNLTPAVKKSLVNLVNYNIAVAGKKYALSYAIEQCVKSFSSMLAGKRKDLLMPKLIELEQHKYE